MNPDQARTAATWLGWGRVALGVTAMVAPELPARPWIGPAEAGRPRVKMLCRSLGARDVGLGLGAVLALRHNTPSRGWVEAGALCDAADLAGTVLSFRSLPRYGRLGILAVTAGSLAACRYLAPIVDT